MRTKFDGRVVLTCQKCGTRYMPIAGPIRRCTHCGGVVKSPADVIGKTECIACHTITKDVSAPVQTAWMKCASCGFNTAMFFYRGKKKSDAD